MMELTCAYIFLLFSVVSATPHGYGTKGGASAKAEASATAGSLGDTRGLPLSIPSGSGFSGSYSKSSSSSFSSASSSASSSSSSFTYSGSGSTGVNGLGANSVAGAKSVAGGSSIAGVNSAAGANSFAGTNGFAGVNGLAGGTTGCGSGPCSHNRVNDVPSLHGPSGASTQQGYRGSNAAASSNAASGSYFLTNEGEKSNKCTSGQCEFESLKKDEDCSSGKCGNVAQSEPASSNYQSSTQCSSGQCGLNVHNNLPTIATLESNDIPAKKYDTSFSGSKDHDHAFIGYNGASAHSTSKSNEKYDGLNHSGNLDVHAQGHGISKCHTPNCNGYDSTAATSAPGSGLSNDHTVPVTYLTTPKEGAPCNSPTCQPDFGTHAGKPTSYNVPLHPTIDVPKGNLPCTNGNCENNQFKNPYPTLGAGSLPSGPAGPILCTSANCGEQYSSTAATDCRSPHCTPTYASSPTSSGSGINYQPGLPNSVSNPKYPSYTSSLIPSYIPSHGHYNSGCKTPDCSGHVSTESDSGAHSQSGFVHHGSSPTIPSYSSPVLIPSIATTGHPLPTSSNTGNYGAVGGTTVIIPGHKHPTESYEKGFGGPSGILKPNEFGIPTNTHVLAPPHTGPSNAIKPSIGASPSAEELPSYTGGFGGPHGLLKPNEFEIKHPSATFNTPATSVSPSGQDLPTYTGGFGAPTGLLKPNNIHSSANAGATANANAGSFGTVSPNTGISTPNQKVPIHHGGYTVPMGTLRPAIDTNVGITPVVQLGSPVVLQSIPTGYSTHTVPTGGLVVPVASLQPNTYFSSNPATSSNIASGDFDYHGHHKNTQLTSGYSTADKNLPTYTGGFGGVAGVLKPNDFQDLTSNSHNKPGTPSSIKPASCSSGSCNVESSNAVAVAKADAVAYTGGFGGPSGLLKPHDGGKIDSKLLSSAQSGYHQGATSLTDAAIGSSGKVNSDEAKAPAHASYGLSGGAAQVNTAAQASASAGAVSSSFGSNNAYSSSQSGVHGAGDKSGSGCGGCAGGSYHGNVPVFGSSSALSIAKAGVVDGLDSGLRDNGASTKSLASAASGAHAFGGAGSYASSSASAQASAGYATKGGYGK